MKRKAFTDLKTKDIETLIKNLNILEKEIINDYMELKMGKLKNVHTTTIKRKDIAKLKSLIKMKEIVEIEKKVTKVSKKAKISDLTDSVKKKEKTNGTS